MKRYKTKAQLNSRVIRVSLTDYHMLKRISFTAGVSIAEALHKTITQAISPTMFPDVTAEPVRTSIAVNRRTSIAVNGSRIPALGIKTKGVRYD
ncbi:hypothetical protein ES708_30818 [subsurface metagenome]